MSDHIYEKSDLIDRLEKCCGKTFATIDNKGMFNHVHSFHLQKGIAGSVVEQCIFGYPPDSRQEADLIVMDHNQPVKTELKTTGMLIEPKPVPHYIAKEPMSITAVGVYDISEQEFYTSHFWEKLEHMLIVYYHYKADHAVTPYEYKDFPLVGYEFHEFSSEDTAVLKNDWETVQKLCSSVVAKFPGPKTAKWKEDVKQAYIEAHGQLRHLLSYIDLAPKFPPRFRLKKPTVSAIISNHFGFGLEQLPSSYTSISAIDQKCSELTAKYQGRTVASLAREFGIPYDSQSENKAICEQITVAMFGGKSAKLNQISIFQKFGLIGKTVVVTPRGGRTEDMKLCKVDFDEITRSEIIDEDGHRRPYTFEDSDFYTYFADHEFLCIVFKEADSRVVEESPGLFVEVPYKLGENKFIGFQRLIFSDEFIDTTVRPVWDDIRTKIRTRTLVDVVERRKDGTVIINKSGTVKSAPNFIKSKDNDVFLRGSGADSSPKHKTERVNEISMLPQYLWIKGKSIVSEIEIIPNAI